LKYQGICISFRRKILIPSGELISSSENTQASILTNSSIYAYALCTWHSLLHFLEKSRIHIGKSYFLDIFTSRASRSPFPTSINASTMNIMHKPGSIARYA